MAKFELGKTFMTKGVDERMKNDLGFMQFVINSFERHCNGDWGDLCKEDKKLNDSALENGDDRIFSKYTYENESIYIITEWDRSATTILFPNEY